MRIQLAQGVGLTVIPTTQFKTTRIAVHFLAPLQKADVAARTLLTSVLETASRKYPTQSELSAYLEGLFGASFGIGVGKEGRMHRVTASMNLLSDQLAQADLLAQGMAFLKQVLLHPLMVNGRFDEAIFTREQHNLKQYLESLEEDRQTQASLGLQALYFQDDPSQATPSFGTPAGLAKVTAKHLVAVYQQMLAQDRIEIVVLGNVDETAVQQLAGDFDFAPRRVDVEALDVDVPMHEVLTDQVIAPVIQAKLNLGYHVDTDYFGEKAYATIVANELFGGSALSKLFTNVREKASLAYYASSSFDQARHLVTVQTGIDAEKRDEVLQLITEQLQQIQQGDFTDAQLQTMKDGLIANRETAYDAPRFLARIGLLESLWPTQPHTLETFIQGVQAVSREQVMQAAQGFELQAIYTLENEVS
ncbi:EF-P 5-aminopentanol modification-associated protein YfmF [Lacticaseibacillus porcinae]|uniref:EF-P 5-aminopentanol modification-associated protein YfmF n=1 Tax=Lacticaseibacillus porcinae TaxID=1123687 RepID=UPI000F777376|nr:pitrilysin family protein [Lacticaseibacillus porcinae]